MSDTGRIAIQRELTTKIVEVYRTTEGADLVDIINVLTTQLFYWQNILWERLRNLDNEGDTTHGKLQ